MEQKEEILVSICSITYNHAPFIRQCLDGFLMQKCDFKYEIIINDDCSTDGTTEILKEYAAKYPDVIRPVFHSENQYQKGIRGMAAKFVYPLALGRYVALCEGDDYWTDPLKLQKQVSFLEKNPDYTMCFHRAEIIKEVPELRCGLVCDNLETRKYLPDEILSNWIVPTASVVLRKECLDYPIKGENRILNGDIFTVMKCASMGKVYGMSDCMSVYRVQKGGVTYNKAGLNNRALRYPEHYECLIENFPGIASQTLEKLLSESYFYRALVQDSLSKKLNDCKKSLKINKKAFFLVLKRHIAVQMKIRGKTLFPSLYDKWKSANGKNKCK